MENIIKEYELALQAYERALSEACSNENCGFNYKYLTDQEISEEKSINLAKNARKSAIDKGLFYLLENMNNLKKLKDLKCFLVNINMMTKLFI